MSIQPVAAQERLRDKKRDLYRTAILDAAERVFGELGYDATKVQRISAEAGVSLTTLYSVFESKWEIYRGVYRRRLGDVMALAQDIVAQDLSSIERLVAGFRMQLGFLMEHPDFLRMQLKEVTAWSTIELLKSPEQVEALGTGFELFIEVFKHCVEDGYFVDEDPELMARTVIAAQQVRLALWMERGMKERPQEVVDDALRHMLRSCCKSDRYPLILRGYGKMTRSEPA